MEGGISKRIELTREIARVRREYTGETRDYAIAHSISSSTTIDDLRWLWSKGHYGCDCHLADLYARAGGEPQRAAVPEETFPELALDAEGNVECSSGKFTLVSLSAMDADGREHAIL